jgi:hypothetical protein
MASSIINSDDGSVSGTTGLKTTGGDDGELILQTNGADSVTLSPSAVVINESGADVDFRIESDTNANAFFLDGATGNVGVGTSSPSTTLEIQAPSTVGGIKLRGRSGANDEMKMSFSNSTGGTELGRIYCDSANYLSVGTMSSLPFVFTTAGSERMRIDSSGRLLVAKTSSAPSSGDGYIFNSNGLFVTTLSNTLADTLNVYNQSAGVYRFYVTNTGTIYATNTSISAISDQRFKENIRDLDVGLDAVMQLKPRKFDWKEGKGQDIKDCRGFIAQEFEQVFPDLIDTWKDPAPEGEEPYKSVRQDLIPVLVKAIQEQQAIIEALETRIAALESN